MSGVQVEVSAVRLAKGYLPNSASMRIACRVMWRATYVAIIAVVGACLPFFNDFVALLGGIAFWCEYVVAP